MTNLAPYVFWVHRWEVIARGVNMLNPNYTLCQITDEMLSLASSTDTESVSIQLKEIANCEIYGFSPARYVDIFFVRISLFEKRELKRGWTEKDELYIAPIEPLGFLASYEEAVDMVEVINALRVGSQPNIPKNPYERDLIRKGRGDEFSEEKWNALTLPSVYYPPPGFWGVAKRPLIIVGIWGIFMLLLKVLTWFGVLY